MNFSRRGLRWLVIVVSAMQTACFTFAAPAAPDSQPPGEAESTLSTVPPPTSTLVQSPVQLFRELLARTPEEQKEFLSDRSPEHQRRILAKLHEYESLKPNQRELRLRATELRWYLWPLLTAPATNRSAQLAVIPDTQRKLVADRLHEWDRLPSAAQKDLLDNEATLRYFTQVEPATEAQKQAVLKSLSPSRRARLQAGINQWQSLPEVQRRKTLDRFNQFFDLTDGEKEKALGNLSDEERRQMERTLKKYELLPAAQRLECVDAFTRFTALSLEERQQFLKNAERWRLMSPDERQNWRELVSQLSAADSPPLPPGFSPPPTLAPPTPPGFPVVPASTVATNGRK